MPNQTTVPPSPLDPCRAVVLSAARTYFGYRRRVVCHPQVPVTAATDPAWLLDAVAAKLDGEGVLVVPGIPNQHNHTPDGFLWERDDRALVDQLDELRARLAEHGWETTDSSLGFAAEYGWSTWRRKGSATVHLCQLGHPHHQIERRDQLVCSLDGSEMIARQLAAFHAGTGVAWRGDPGVTFHQMILAPYDLRDALRRAGARVPPSLAKRKEPTWYLSDDGADKAAARLGTEKIQLTRPRAGQGAISWSRRLSTAEKAMPYVHMYDGRKMYLAAMVSATYAWGDLTYVDSPPFEPAWSGFWRLILPKGAWYASRGSYPPIIRRKTPAGEAIATTPTVALLLERGAKFAIRDAWLCEDSGRVHRTIGERLRDLTTMGGYTRRTDDIFKALYAHGAGLWNAAGGRIWRPDWFATTQEQAAAQVYRNCNRAADAGYGWPLAIETDAVYYAADHDKEDVKLSMALGARNEASQVVGNIGRMRYEGTMKMRDYILGKKKG